MLLWPHIRSYYLQISGGTEETHKIPWVYHVSVPSKHDCGDVILAPDDCNKYSKLNGQWPQRLQGCVGRCRWNSEIVWLTLTRGLGLCVCALVCRFIDLATDRSPIHIKYYMSASSWTNLRKCDSSNRNGPCTQ